MTTKSKQEPEFKHTYNSEDTKTHYFRTAAIFEELILEKEGEGATGSKM